MESNDKSDVAGFQRLQNKVDKIFLDLLRGERTLRYGRAVLRPNADVYYDTRENKVVVRLELPGIDPEQIDLEVEGNSLRVSGVRMDERHPDAIYQQMEIMYGRFERTIMLPPEIDGTRASASYNNGFLEIVLPLKPRSTKRRIDIASAEQEEREHEQ